MKAYTICHIETECYSICPNTLINIIGETQHYYITEYGTIPKPLLLPTFPQRKTDARSNQYPTQS